MTSSYEAALESGQRRRERAENGSQTTRAKGSAAPTAEVDDAPTVPTWDLRGSKLRRWSVLVDLIALCLVGGLTAAGLVLAERPILPLDVAVFFAMAPLWPLIGIAMRAYHPHSVGRGLSITASDEFATIFRVSTTWSWFVLVARSLLSPETTQLLPSLLVWSLSIPVLLVSRSLLRRFVRERGWYRQRVLVIGTVIDAAKVISRIHRHPEWGLTVAREIDVCEGEAGPITPGGSAIDTRLMLRVAEELNVSRVIFATPPDQLDARTDMTRSFIESGAQVDFVPGEAEILRSGAEIGHLEGLPLMSMPGARPPRSWGIFKRTMDLTLAVPALILTAPVIGYAMLRIKRDSPGPLLYRQLRTGLDGRHFELLKLRTMTLDADARLSEVAALNMHAGGIHSGGFKAVADPRVTRAGARLRRHSLDELPQLWNVVRGDMSLVGPRPLPLAEDERVAGHYELRRHVRPGITGAWQVSGRSDIPFHDMLRLDYSYVLNWSLASDLKLLAETVGAVLRGRGAY